MTGPSRPVRIVVRCPGTTLPAWQADCIRRLRASEGVNLAAIVVDDSDPKRHDPILWRAYRSLLERRLEATRPIDLAAELHDVDRIRPEETADRLASTEGDALLDLGSGAIPASVRSTVADEIWRFSSTDPLPGLGEVQAGKPTVEAALARSTGTDGTVLRSGVFPTIPYSAARTIDRVLFGMARWPTQAATDLASDVPSTAPVDRATPLAFDPGLREIGALLGRQARAIGDAVTGGSDGWTIGLTDRPIHEVARNPADIAFEWIPRSDPRRFVADPFPARIDGEGYLFFEEYYYETGLGTLSYLPLDGPLRLEETRPAFERPFHLSYPYTFEYDGETYVVPETAAAGEVALYRLVNPDHWERAGTILADAPALDASIVEYDGRWWLFCTRLDDLPETNLYVYHADEPTGEWRPHANNPVKTDVRSARPAGTPWIEDGKLYRPTQDCVGGYGRAIAVNRVETLTPSAFSEREVERIEPDPAGPYPYGRHTLSTDGEVTVIDANGRLFDAYHVSTQVRTVARLLSNAVSRRRT